MWALKAYAYVCACLWKYQRHELADTLSLMPNTWFSFKDGPLMTTEQSRPLCCTLSRWDMLPPVHNCNECYKTSAELWITDTVSQIKDEQPYMIQTSCISSQLTQAGGGNLCFSGLSKNTNCILRWKLQTWTCVQNQELGLEGKFKSVYLFL